MAPEYTSYLMNFILVNGKSRNYLINEGLYFEKLSKTINTYKKFLNVYFQQFSWYVILQCLDKNK